MCTCCLLTNIQNSNGVNPDQTLLVSSKLLSGALQQTSVTQPKKTRFWDNMKQTQIPNTKESMIMIKRLEETKKGEEAKNVRRNSCDCKTGVSDLADTGVPVFTNF